MRRILTDALLRGAAAPSVGRIEYSDIRCVGLQFRVTASGVRSWSFRFRDPASARTSRATIGAYPAVGLAEARNSANQMRKVVASGGNPVELKRRERATAADRLFGALATRYLKEHAARHKRPRSAEEDRRNLELHVLPRWTKRRYETLKRSDVIELIEAIITEGKETTANRVQSLVSKIFSFAVDAGLLDSNPCTRLKKRAKETARERVLTDEEIRWFWQRTALGSDSALRALRLILLTGCRPTEIATTAVHELQLQDAKRSSITIPAERMKGKRPHFVPLSPLGRTVVTEALSDLSDEGEPSCLFPATRGQKAITRHALARAMTRLATDESDNAEAVPKTWIGHRPTPHDLRRTVNTRLSMLGVAKEIRDAVLAHVPRDIEAKHYNLHDKADQKRAALTRWSMALSAILAEQPANNVMPLQRRGAA